MRLRFRKFGPLRGQSENPFSCGGCGFGVQKDGVLLSNQQENKIKILHLYFYGPVKNTKSRSAFTNLSLSLVICSNFYRTMMIVSQPSLNASASDLDEEECPYLYGTVWRKIYLTENTYRNLVAITCMNFLSVLPTIVLNALVIFVVATRRRLQTNTNILLACLAGTDLLTGLVVYPLTIAVDIKRILGVGPFCTLEKLNSVAIAVVGFASLSHLVSINIDRYIAIKYPLRYLEIATKQRLMAGVLLIWAMTVLVTIKEISFALIDSESVFMKVKDVILIFVCLVYIAVIIYTNRYVFRETRRQKKRIQTEQVTHEEAKRMKRDKKAANTLAIILGAIALTYLPTIIAFLLTLSSMNTLEPGVTSILWRWCLNSVLLGSLLNPVIYFWRIKKLRRTFVEILHFRQLEGRSADIQIIGTQRHPRPEIQICM